MPNTVDLQKQDAPKVDQIFNIKVPSKPDMIFEYHPKTKKVYMARLNVKPCIGELIAPNVEDHGMAINIVNVWLRGYNTAKHEAVLEERFITKDT